MAPGSGDNREITRLRAQLEEQRAAVADRDETIERLSRDLDALTRAMESYLRGRHRSPRLAEGQGVLFPAEEPTDSTAETFAPEEEPEEAGSDPVDQASRAKSRRSHKLNLDLAGLPTEERLHELPEEERLCPLTGLQLVATGETVFDEIDYQAPRIVRIIHRRTVYGLPPEVAEERQASTLTAPMPPRPLEDCAASAMLLAWMLVQKYAWHLPLYRQEQIFARDGLRIARQTLCDWVLRAAEALTPIADCLLAKVRAGPVLQIDDTPVQCQGGKGETYYQAYLWTLVNPEVSGVVYQFTRGRGSDLIAAIIESFDGFLVGDGYGGNRAAARKVSDVIRLAGCWAHTTRKFRDALIEAPATAKLFQKDIKELYAVEKQADEEQLDPEQRVAYRAQYSRPILARILARARRLRDDFTDAGKMAGALRYLLNQWWALRRFLENGIIPIDNNACERGIRPIAIGRRNWLFAGSERGGHAAATIYTLIESCKIAEIDPVAYLADVLVRVATHPASKIDELLPSNWAELTGAAPRSQLAVAVA